jgi:hypothetical protein
MLSGHRCHGYRAITARARIAVPLFAVAVAVTFPITFPASFAAAIQEGNSASSAPRKGEILLEGTVAQAPSDIAVPEGSFVLRVARLTDANGKLTVLTQPRNKVIRYTAMTRLTSTRLKRQPSRSDIDHGAGLAVVGIDQESGSDLAARNIEIMAGPLETVGENLLRPTDEKAAWHGYVEMPAAEGSIEPDSTQPGVLRATVKKTDGTVWKAQAGQIATLANGGTYTVRFRVRADAPRLMTVDSREEPIQYRNIGLRRVVPIDSEWRIYRETFKADMGKAASGYVPVFLLGARTGNVYFSDVAVVAGDHTIPKAEMPSPGVGKNLLFHPDDYHCWLLIPDPVKATLDSEGKALRITITETPSAELAKDKPNSVQLCQMADLEPGRKYRLRFQAKANAPRTIQVISAIDRADYRITGLDQKTEIGTNYKSFEWTFTADKTDSGHDKAPCFLLGDKPGTVWIADASLELISS